MNKANKQRAARRAIWSGAAMFAAGIPASHLAAQPAGFTQSGPAASTAIPTYADLADLADAAEIVLRVQVRKQAQLKAERAPGLAPGFARLYIEAQTGALISGSASVGETLSYLVDVPLDSRGKAPKLKKRDLLLFARPVAGRPGTVQLVGPGAQMQWNDALEQRLRPILSALVAPDAPPEITGVREALSVRGNLAGESETQLFLATASGNPVSVTIVNRPSMAPVWGVSWSEIVDQSARPPRPETLGWYRLACFLPQRLPAQANISREVQARGQAETDYAFMMQQLGPCERALAR